MESDGEQEIRLLCNKICDRIDWNFAYNEQEKCFYWFKNGSHAENFDGKALKGEMDETFFMHFLVLGSSGWRHGTEAYAEYTKHIFVDTQYGFKYYSTRPTAKLGYLVQPHICVGRYIFKAVLCINKYMLCIFSISLSSVSPTRRS